MAVSIHNNIVSGPDEQEISAHLSYGQYLFDKMKGDPEKRALVSADPELSMTFKTVLQESVNLATSLKKLDLKKGDVVALSSENRPEFIVASLAIIFCGAKLSTLNVTFSPGELTYTLQIIKPKFIISSSIAAQKIYECCKDMPFVQNVILFGNFNAVPAALFYDDLIKEHVSMNDFELVDVYGFEDVVAIMWTSGTTGLPKAVMLTHVNLLTMSAHIKYYSGTNYKKTKNNNYTCFSTVPWTQAYGFISTMALLSFNISVYYISFFEEKTFLQMIEMFKIKMMILLPTLAKFLAKHPLVPRYDLSSLCEIWCGAAPLSSKINKLVAQRTGAKFIKQGYGLTELTMACCVNMDGGGKLASCGTPGPGVQIKVSKISTGEILSAGEWGELWIKSPLQMKGYLVLEFNKDLIDYEGYMRTGDIGYYDSDGYFYVANRITELINYKGLYVPPAILEDYLLQHPGIADCAVVGRPDEAGGDFPTAFVVREPKAQVTAEDIMKFMAEKVYPTENLLCGGVFINEIPKDISGKILRRQLKMILPNILGKSKL